MNSITNNTRDVARELARKYSTMTHDELDLLESVLVPHKYLKGQMILSEGDIDKDIMYIAKGMTRQFYFKNGKELTEHIATEGGIVMCIESLFKEKPTEIQVEALEQTWIYSLPKDKLEQVALHNSNIQILSRKSLEESLILSQVHADLVRFETAQERYQKLCKLMPQVILRAPLVYIASYLQMTPETLSRVRTAALKG